MGSESRKTSDSPAELKRDPSETPEAPKVRRPKKKKKKRRLTEEGEYDSKVVSEEATVGLGPALGASANDIIPPESSASKKKKRKRKREEEVQPDEELVPPPR